MKTEVSTDLAAAVELLRNGEIAGALTETRLYQKLIADPECKHSKVSQMMEKPFPVVEEGIPYSIISGMINRENPAVLVKQQNGDYQIITKYDIIQALAK